MLPVIDNIFILMFLFSSILNSFSIKIGVKNMNYRTKLNFLFFIIFFTALNAEVKKTIEFESEDGLMITADTYIAHDLSKPFIVLFHQAGWSRGEYLEIAPKLNKLGFNCMAIDQRSGYGVNGVLNKTAERAEKQSLLSYYPDAIPDLKAAISYAKENFAKGKLIIWGSSYSSALVLKLAGDEENLCDGLLSFAPGEYFERNGKAKDWITQSAKNITKPVFITSAKNEKDYWTPIFEKIKSKDKYSYLPETDGNHGSRALWEKFNDNEGYWKAVNEFLKKYFL